MENRLSDGLRVKEHRTELTRHHNGRDLTLLHQSNGSNNHSSIQELMERDDLKESIKIETKNTPLGTFEVHHLGTGREPRVYLINKHGRVDREIPVTNYQNSYAREYQDS